MIAINRALRHVGVLWMACRTCGRDWPFPIGAVSNPELQRDFVCSVCLSAWRASLQRGEIPKIAGDAQE